MNPTARSLRGFSLIEMMVGLAIGLFALLAMSQIMLTFSQQRNAITQTTSSQNNGVMALYLLEKDLGQAGYAMLRLQNCDRINFAFGGVGYFNSPYGTDLPGDTTSQTALTALPVRIREGGTGSDTLEIQYGDSVSGVPGTEITAPGQPGSYADDFPVLSAVGFNNGDRFVANVANGAASGICTLAQVSNANPVASPIAHAATGAYPYNVTLAPGGTGWNPVTAWSYDPASSPRTPFIANLGNFRSRRYTTSANTATTALTIAELPGFASNTLVDDIVFLKAQYGVATTPCVAATTCVQIESWETPSTFTITNANASRVIAIRVGVVARSPLYEKEAPAGAATTLSVLPPIDGTSTLAAPAAGQCATDATTLEVKCTVPDTHYRYRVYSTVVPLKNVIWSN